MALGAYDRVSFSKQLRQARERLGLTQAELADLTGFEESAISRYETPSPRGPSIQNFRKLVIALGVSADYLLYITQSMGVDHKLAQQIEKLSTDDYRLAKRFVARLARSD